MQKNLRVLFFIISVSLFFISCTDKESELGRDMQDPNSILNTHKTDAVEIEAYTILYDSLSTSKLSTSLLGVYADNVFGTVNASVFSQISLRDNKGFELPSTAELDSLILVLGFSGAYSDLGLMNKNIQIQVYQLEEEMDINKNYYSTSTLKYKSTPLFEGEVLFNSIDSVVLDGKKQAPQVRIPLDPNFMNDIGRKTFSSNTDFVNYVKGLHIKVVSNTSSNGIGYFNLPSTVSGMMLYYKGGVEPAYNFVFDPKGARFTHFEHDYTGRPLEAFMNNAKDSIPGTSNLYLQAMGGTVLKVYFPNLAKWEERTVAAINKASLILPISANSPLGYSIDIDKITVICYNKTEGGYINAKYDSSKKQFVVPLTQYIQNILNGTQEDCNLYLYINNSATLASRVVLNGTNTTSNPMKLEIIYTK